MGAIDSPDVLVTRDTPKAGARMSRRAMGVVFAVIAVVVIVMMFNLWRKNNANKAVTERAQTPANLQSAEVSGAAITEKAPDGLLAPPPVNTPAIAASRAPASDPAAYNAVPALSSGGELSAPPLSAADQRAAELDQERAERALQAAQAGLAVPDWNIAQNNSAGAELSASGVFNEADEIRKQLAATSSAGGGLGGAAELSGQKAKQAFADGNSGVVPPLLMATRQSARSPYMLSTGTIIGALTAQGMNSDIPGELRARVASNVYDSASGRYLLIPQNAMLFGRYDPQVAFGQKRALVVWTRIIFPDGSTFELGGMNGADLGGYAGLSDKVDNHYGRLVSFAALSSIMSAGLQLSQPQQKGDEQLSSQQLLAGETGRSISQLGMQVTQRNLDIQPTLSVRPGYRFTVIINKDMVFPGPYQ
jgi:type IV secretion system protein VirB10